MNSLSIRISTDNQAFVNKLLKQGISKTEDINKALDLYRKAQLRIHARRIIYSPTLHKVSKIIFIL